MFATLIIKIIFRRVYMTNFQISQVCFFSFFLSFFLSLFCFFWVHAITFVIKKFTLSSLLPLLLVFLFFLLLLLLLLLLLYLFVIIFNFHCCYSYDVNITIISLASLISKSTLLLFICEFQPVKFFSNHQFFYVH